MHQLLANQVLISFVLRMHSYCSITQHSFDTGGSHNNFLRRIILQLVCEIDYNSKLHLLGVAWYLQVCSLLNVLEDYLNVGNSGLQYGRPIYQSVCSIDKPVIVEAHKGLLYCSGQCFVHGEYCSIPIQA